MAGSGNKQNSRRSKSRKPMKPSMFVEGGLLSDWSPVVDSPHLKGKSNNGSNSGNKSSASKNKSIGSGSGGKSKASTSNSRIIEPVKRQMNAVGYNYPQIDPLPDDGAEEHKKLGELDPIVLIDTKIVACIDTSEIKECETVKYTNEHDANTEVDDSFHRGLGFIDKEENLCVKEEKEGFNSDSSSSEEVETDPSSSPEKNSGFLSIGGMKLYTHDISDVEDDEDNESVESSESEDSSNSSDSDTSSDIDDEVAKDYIEGIGRSYKDSNFGVSDGDADINDTLIKFGGIALQEASREYGMKKPQSRKKSQSQTNSIKFRADKDDWSAIDDLMLVKDPRIVNAQRKKHAKSNHPRRLPGKNIYECIISGEKKKQRQDTIALKRRERMIRRGVDLKQINSKLEQMVQNEGDIMSFQLMHSRDCSQVQKLASIYRLRSCSQGSGKRRFVTVTLTEHTGMPSSTDRIRLEKACKIQFGDADLTVNNMSSGKMAANRSKIASKGNTGDLLSVKVNSLTSIDTEIPYSYYSLPFCKPQEGVKDSAENLGIVLVIFLRTVRRDLTHYEELDKEAQAQMNEELSGWKLVVSDVFRVPDHPALLCVMVGDGIQILGMAVVTILFAALGFMSPASRGTLLTGMLFFYMILGILAGYVAVRMWRTIFSGDHKGWVSVCWKVSCFFPGIAFLILFVLNFLLWGSDSTGGFDELGRNGNKFV
ncbi:hypothetical protein E3N88_41815 [Mikania micrantha]|uniref:R3H domain-containing protein n=1 Tax=Mikania micrantha TaxID=192012 RepID=A0A5N6LJJ7_9ASTR|nr:hypothetical protein E3N88_41815 [Mikania micrantha]